MTKPVIAEKFTVYLDGTLTTQSPFANSPANNRDPKTDVALLPRLPVNIGGAFHDTAVIPAATIRGKVRRAAAMVVLQRFLQAGEEASFNDWLLWAVGGVKGSGSDTIDARRRHALIEGNALLAMFGAGASQAGGMVGGRFLIDPAIPDGEIPVAVVKGARAAENRNPALVEFLPAAEMDRVHAYTDANRERSVLEVAVKKLTASTNKAEKALRENAKKVTLSAEEIEQNKVEILRLTERLAEVSGIAASMGSDNSIGRPLAGYEVIPKGVVFPHRMVIKAATMQQIGFVLESLSLFAIDPVIGAHVASGCGRIAASYDLRLRSGQQRDVSNVGTLSFGDLDGLVTQSDFATQALAAWNTADIDYAVYRAG